MIRRLLSIALVVAASGCDDGTTPPGTDGGSSGGMDGSMMMMGTDSSVPPGTDGGVAPGTDGCVPSVEICGDRIDQNCDGRDTGCGDNDGDGIMACRAGDDLTMCDCDDGRTDVRPAFGAVPGAPEVCDGVDNDCNGRVDEAAECCAGCADVSPRSRADVCAEDGTCDCSTEPGMGPCAEGMTCCASGCVDVQSDTANCGFCNSRCTVSADRCTMGTCMCGSGPACDLDRACTGGSC